MDPTELFRKALQWHIEARGTSQSKVAAQLSVKANEVSDFIHGRKNFSEWRKSVFARQLGYRYEDFLRIGRQLIEAQPGGPWSADQVLISRADELVLGDFRTGIGRRVEEILERAGLQKEIFAERLGVTPECLTDLFEGRGWSGAVVARVCATLGTFPEITEVGILDLAEPSQDMEERVKRLEEKIGLHFKKKG